MPVIPVLLPTNRIPDVDGSTDLGTLLRGTEGISRLNCCRCCEFIVFGAMEGLVTERGLLGIRDDEGILTPKGGLMPVVD